MNRLSKIAALTIISSFIMANAAFAVMGFLTDQSTKGLNKYCEYSNGVIITISSVELCPLSIR